jgi:hypothetical protein
MDTFDDIDVQEGLICDCIRAIVFCDYIYRKRPEKRGWMSIMDMCYADAVVSWCSLFGQNSQESHWRRFLESLNPTNGWAYELFSTDFILSRLKISEREWSDYHSKMVRFRNVRLSHVNINQEIANLPRLDTALKVVCLYRDWFNGLLLAANEFGYQFKIENERTEDVILEYRGLIAEICV